MIKLKNITKLYNNKAVLNDVSISFHKGDVVALIGPSGAGKTTLLRTINYLEKPDSGQVYFDAQEICDKTVLALRPKIGMVFQNFNLFANMTVLENVTTALVNVKNMTKEAAIDIAKAQLKSVGMNNKIDEMPKNLSGGQKQRVAIARALAMEPEVLLFDEPTSALDPENVKYLIDLIGQIASPDKIIIFITHEMQFMKNIANRIVFMKDSKIVHDLPKEKFLTLNLPEMRSFIHG